MRIALFGPRRLNLVGWPSRRCWVVWLTKDETTSLWYSVILSSSSSRTNFDGDTPKETSSLSYRLGYVEIDRARIVDVSFSCHISLNSADEEIAHLRIPSSCPATFDRRSFAVLPNSSGENLRGHRLKSCFGRLIIVFLYNRQNVFSFPQR